MKGKIFLLLFASPFFGVGVWMTWSIFNSVSNSMEMGDWPSVEARLISAGYETHTGDDSDTYEAYARYTYDYQGHTYTNDRIGLSSGSDNIGDYQADTGRALSAAMNRGEMITVYVNPENPQDAIIDRSLRWGLLGFKSIFMLVFGGAGLGLILFAIFSGRKNKLDPQEFSARPWLANSDWQAGVITSSSKAAMYGAWVFAMIWNLISAPLPFLIYGEVLDKQNYMALIGLLFPLVGMLLLTWAIRNTLEWRRFGRAPVSLDPFPGSIGGHVGGTIEIRLPYDPALRFSLTLTSLKSYVSGSGKNRSRREKAEWQDSQVAHAEHGAKGTRLTFRFEVPDGLAESDADPDDDTYNLWRLNLKAELPGTDIDRDYEIPVYATRQQSERLPEFSIRKAAAQQNRIDDIAVRRLVRLGYGAEGRSMLFPIGRNLMSGTVGAVIGGVFAGVGAFLILKDHSLFIGAVFSLVGGLICLFSLYSILNSLEIHRQGGSVRTVRRLLGVPVGRHEFLPGDFLGFSKKSTLQTQSGGKHVMHYSVYANTRSGQKVVVGEGLKGSSEADAMMRMVAAELGLPHTRIDGPGEPKRDDSNLLSPDA